MILDQCNSCDLVQLRHTVDPNVLYGNHYWYESALNPKLKQNLLDIAEYANAHSDAGDAILDIGANDGTLLSGVHEDRIRIGCEPASNLWSKCAEHCDVLLPGMWDSGNLKHKCKIVTAIGMFYDMDDPNDFIRGISDVLTDDGVFVAQLMGDAAKCSWPDLYKSGGVGDAKPAVQAVGALDHVGRCHAFGRAGGPWRRARPRARRH